MSVHKIGDNMKTSTETRLALLEQNNLHFTEALKRIDHNIIALSNNLMTHMNEKFDKVDKKFEQIDKKFDSIDKRFESLNGKIDHNFKYVITTMLTLFVLNGLMPAIASALQRLLS